MSSAGRRIVIFVPNLQAFGGVERQILDLSYFLHSKNLPHTILCHNHTIDLPSHAHWPMEVHALEPARNALAEGWAIAQYFRAPRNTDIQAPLFFDLKGAFNAGLFRYPEFHLHLTDPPSLLPRDVSKFAPSVRRRFRMQGTENPGWRLAMRAEAVHWFNKRGVGRARSLIATTEGIARELEALYSRPATVIRPGVQPPPDDARPASAEAGRMRFLSVSRLEESKRIDWILKALAKLENSDAPLSVEWDWVLDIVGEGSQAFPLRGLAESLGIGGRVKFHGLLSDESLNVIFARASIFLMPAVQGYGLPALESLARGVPVILHRHSGASEILDQPPWVEIIEQGFEDLAPAIQRMIANISSGTLQRTPKAVFPTATDWANKIAMACGWS